MNIQILSSSEDLPVWLSQRLSGSGKDFSRNMVLFPGKRPAHFLRRALAEREGSSLITPAIFSMDQFIDHWYEKISESPGVPLKPLDAVAILYEIHQSAAAEKGQKKTGLEEFFPVGLEYYRALEELCLENISPEKVREIDLLAEEKLPPHAISRMAALSRYYREFYLLAKQEGYSTRSIRYREVSDRLGPVPQESWDQIFVAGFFGLTRAEQTLFAKMAGWPNTRFVFQEGPGIREKAAEIGFDLPDESDKPLWPEKLIITRSPDVHGELFGASSVLFKENSAGNIPDQKTVLVLPSSGTLIPVLSQMLIRMNPEQYNISLGYPLWRTPLFEFFFRLIDLIVSGEKGSFSLVAYLDFMLHPYMKSIPLNEGSENRFFLIRSLEEIFGGGNTRRFMTLSEIESHPDLIRSIASRGGSISLLGMLHRNTIEKLMNIENFGDFCSKAAKVLDFISNESPAAVHPLFAPSLEAFLNHLEEVASSRLSGLRAEDPAEYFRILKHSLEPVRVPFEGTPLQGLQVLGFLETRNLKFDRVIFLDLNEDVLPESSGIDLFLPPKVRKILGLPTVEDRENLSGYYFNTLFRGSKEVYFFYVENNRLEKSRFLERILWEIQKRDHVTDTGSLVQSIAYTVNLKSARPEAVGKSKATIEFLRNFRFSAKSLQTYLDCPLKFYFHYPLRLNEKKEVRIEHEREEIGSLVHIILNDFFIDKQGRLLTQADLRRDDMVSLIHRKFESMYGKELSGDTLLMRSQVSGHLVEYLFEIELPKIRSGSVEITGLEKKFLIGRKGFALSGKIDRIEKRGERLIVLDYKTGSNSQNYAVRFDRLVPDNRETWRAGIKNLQLPFYHYLYSEAEGISPLEMETSYLFLGKNKLNASAEVFLFNDPSRKAAQFEMLKTVIFGLLQEVCDPAVPFFPETDEGKACQTCEYQVICHSKQG